MEYVIGIESGLDACTCAAMAMDGETIARKTGRSTSHLTIGKGAAAQAKIARMVDELIASFGGNKDDCRCVIVGAAGIDSPDAKTIVSGLYAALQFKCPVLCLNDGSVALYATTGGLGVLAISGNGSIAVGRNAEGTITRSGGYPATILGNEGSSQWMALSAMHHASMWIDGSIPETALVKKINAYFSGLDANKLTECANALRRRPIDVRIADLVFEAAQEGDEAAVQILKKGASDLFFVADTCVRKLGFKQDEAFLSGVWGSVFTRNDLYFHEYQSLFLKKYPHCRVVFPSGDTADGAAHMALDYLDAKIPFINDLQ